MTDINPLKKIEPKCILLIVVAEKFISVKPPPTGNILNDVAYFLVFSLVATIIC